MLRKSHAGGSGSIFHLIFFVLLVSGAIYTWKCLGCFGYSQCYLCRPFSADIFLKRSFEPPSTDFSRLMDLKNFSLKINNLVCNNTELILLVLIHSSPSNFENRVTIRSTWGKMLGKNSRLLFLLGVSTNNTVQEQVDEENFKNKDIVQGNFLDSYRNLTYKHVMGLKWTKYYCPNSKYILKTDDDVFVNSPHFLDYIAQDKDHLPETELMRCLPVYEGRAKRTSRSKWKVSWTEYQFRQYPPYCQGFAILYSPDVVSTLYTKAQMANYFWIDDVFVTGFLAMSANYKPSTFGKFLLEPGDYRTVIQKDSDEFSYVIGPFNLDVSDIWKLWEKAQKSKFVSE